MTVGELVDLVRWDWRVNPATSWDGVRARLLLLEVRCEAALHQWSAVHRGRFSALIWTVGRGVGSLWQWALCGSTVPGSATIGRGLRLPHPQNIIVASGARLGDFCTLYQNVSIARDGMEPPEARSPRLGDRVLVGAGAVVIGDLDVGADVLVGAGAVVTHSVAAGSRATIRCTVAPRCPAADPAAPGSARHLQDPYSLWR
jgi:serine O-acetyltransferase